MNRSDILEIAVDAQGVATLWLDRKGEKQNVLTLPVIDALESALREVMADSRVKAIVIASRKKDFLAGADIASFKAEKPGDFRPLSARGHALLNEIAQSRKPFVAAIHGTAYGLGTELPLACHIRIASDDRNTKMALPEVKLGVLPGSGGTQRLPRLVGLRNALDMMLTGKNIFARKAKQMGLVDEVVPHAKLHAVASQWALQYINKIDSLPEMRRKKRKRSLVDWFLDDTSVGRNIVFGQAMKTAMRQSQGNYPAVPEIIRCVEIGLAQGVEAGFAAEAEKFEALLLGSVSKELINIFFNMTEKKKNPYGEAETDTRTLGILGAGFMGAGIAEVSIGAGLDVRLKDLKPEGIAAARKGIWKSLEKELKRKSLTKTEAESRMAQIIGQTDYAHFETVDVVIEAVFEEMGLKKRILAETEPHLRPDAIFATNTSALSITEISTAAKRPENVVGLHYFSPVPKMPLLEIVKTPKTAESVLQKAYELGTRQGKTCIVVNDSPGFFANRILAPYLNEAMLLLEEGADMAQLDRVMKKWGFPVGPIALMDEVGIDVGAHVMSGDLMELFRQYKGVKICTALLEMNKAGLKGRKTKLGFYDYSSKKKKPNEAAYGYFAHRGSRKSFDDAEISARLSLLMLNEAARTLAEGVIATVRDGDIGAVFGIGFPPFRGGPFRYMDSVGIAQIVVQMEQAAQQFGERFAPCTLLREYAQAEKRFY